PCRAVRLGATNGAVPGGHAADVRDRVPRPCVQLADPQAEVSQPLHHSLPAGPHRRGHDDAATTFEIGALTFEALSCSANKDLSARSNLRGLSRVWYERATGSQIQGGQVEERLP